MNKLILAIATGLGTGYSPVASGTVGSFLAMLIYWYAFPYNQLYVLALAAIVTAISVYTGGEAEKIFNSRDDGRIVIDEFAGYYVSILFLPKTLFFTIGAFLLFRLFDVIKPWFVNRVQDWKGGWGVTFDDVFAGMFANITLQVIRYAFFR
jgi:phosphatidylglycerophosphatase A